MLKVLSNHPKCRTGRKIVRTENAHHGNYYASKCAIVEIVLTEITSAMFVERKDEKMENLHHVVAKHPIVRLECCLLSLLINRHIYLRITDEYASIDDIS